MGWLERLSRLRPATASWGALYVLLFVVAGILTLPQYGLTWDEANGDLFIGERYWYYYLSFNPAYLDFERADLDIHQRPFNLYVSPYRDKPNEFPPIGNTLSAITMDILGQRLGWLDPVDAFHLAKVLMVGVLLWVLYRFAVPRLGGLTAWLAILVLSTFPRFWGDMHFNPLDIPETVFFALTLLAFYYWTERPSWQRALLAGALFGGALGNKGNALFIPPLLFAGLFPWNLFPRLWTPALDHLRKCWSHYLLTLVAATDVHFITWPYLFADPTRIQNYYRYLFTEGYLTAPSQWNLDPLIQTITTLPEIELILLPIGLVCAAWSVLKHRSRWWQLVLVWFALPILRTSLPGSANFDGIRHFEEFVPALALLAGLGGAMLVRLAARVTGRRTLAAVGVTLLIVLNVAFIEARYFPYEHLYYNSLVGGLGGAQQQSSEATDYWGGSYRQGIQWLNGHVERDAQVHVAIAPWIVKLAAPLWLRTDIGLIDEPAVGRKIESGFPVYVMFFTRAGWYNSVATYCVQNKKPVYQIKVDGATILEIYHLTDANGVPR